MTLAEFIKSKRHVACLETAGCITGELNQEGWVYGETGLFIEGPASGIQCSLMLERSEYCTQEMFPLEGMLYDYAVEEGFISGDRWTDDEIDHWQSLMAGAMPVNDQDEGSILQVAASVAFHNHVGLVFGKSMQDEFTSFSEHGDCIQEYMQVFARFILGRDIFCPAG